MPRTIRTLAREEVQTLVDWAAAEGWNPGLNDAALFQAADPQGFIGAFIDGEMAAGISAVAYGDGFGFIGLYICRPDRRAQGHGKAVWDAGIARLGNRTIGLDGVVEQQANYRSMGFAPAYRTIRFMGSPNVPAAVGNDVRAIGPELVPDILDYDRRFFPGPRRPFLEHWLRPPHMAQARRHCGIWHRAPMPGRLQDRPALCRQPGRGKPSLRRARAHVRSRKRPSRRSRNQPAICRLAVVRRPSTGLRDGSDVQGKGAAARAVRSFCDNDVGVGVRRYKPTSSAKSGNRTTRSIFPELKCRNRRCEVPRLSA